MIASQQLNYVIGWVHYAIEAYQQLRLAGPCKEFGGFSYGSDFLQKILIYFIIFLRSSSLVI